MSMPVAAADAYLDIDLDGLQLIEASAGTGKTFTLATLVTRLVVERGLSLGQILAVTFTEAATQELRARLRKRLALAAAISDALLQGHPVAVEEHPEAALTLRILQRQLAVEDAASLHARLRRAEHETDLAAVFTIHGFCARVLTEHALQTGQAFDAPEMIGSQRELLDEVAADVWRSHGADARDAELLQGLWTSPDALAGDLDTLLRIPRLLPERPQDAADPLTALHEAFRFLSQAHAEHLDDARAKIADAFAGKHFDGRKARAASFEQAWQSLEHGITGGGLGCDDPHLDKLTPERMQGFAKAGAEDRVPTSPLFNALSAWFAADRQRRQWLAEQALILLYRIRDDARQRLALLKQTRRLQTYDDLIDEVARALDGPQGEALARALRKQYAIALVDEFQDTDARQWSIFRRVFADKDLQDGAAPALFLIGDPKQAIYGFRGGDVHTYLAAKQEALEAPPLLHNFRSRPSVLRAIEALYAQAGEHAFVDAGIRFHPVQPGEANADSDYLRQGAPAPALTLRVLANAETDADGAPKTFSAPQSRQLAAEACVSEIRTVLDDARAGKAQIDGAPVQPGAIAVLVRSHAEATLMQATLAAVGIPAVAAGKRSLFETEQAQELLAVFDALLQPADEGRLRAALSTVLLGVDAAGIARLDHDDEARSARQLLALQWRERWQRHGPLALVSDLCAANAERLLQLHDGERRLTNALQLGELLQEADARALGMHGLVDWLRGHIADADANDEQQLLRLESDARRVQILTLHKAKGLEFPLVFLPFIGIGRSSDKPARHCQVPTADGHVLHWKLGKDDDSQRWSDAVVDWEHEQRAEDARLLYVGLTRAEHALWLACGDLYKHGNAPLASMVAQWAQLEGSPDIVVDSRPAQGLPPPLPLQASTSIPAARRSQRVVPRDWWVYSFTQLSKADAGEYAAAVAVDADEKGAGDEPDIVLADDTALPAAFDPRFSGSRFGNVLHEALEHVDFNAWASWKDQAAPAAQEQALRAALLGGGYAEVDLDDGVAELASLVGRTLTVPLPEGGRLCELPADARRAELEFHFALKPTPVEALLATLHAHGVARGRRAFGLRRQLEGLMTGKIDLTYRREGRWYLLDYKSNRLPTYDDGALAQAMAHSEYDLQALIYTVALHRWLRFRLGDGYDYARDFGGVRYLFSRGLEWSQDRTGGLHAWTPPRALVEALDALFAGGRP